MIRITNHISHHEPLQFMCLHIVLSAFPTSLPATTVFLKHPIRRPQGSNLPICQSYCRP